MVIFPRQNLSLKTKDMTEFELQIYLLSEYPQENGRCGTWCLGVRRTRFFADSKRINNIHYDWKH